MRIDTSDTSNGLEFFKLVGTGNDFVFIDARTQAHAHSVPVESRPEFVEKICNRNFGVGADGVVFIEDLNDIERASLSQLAIRQVNDDTAMIKWDFYNADGSSAEMCGNATRCVGRWVKETLGKSKTLLLTAPGLLAITIKAAAFPTHPSKTSEKSETIVTELPFIKIEKKKIDFLSQGAVRHAVLINTGVPHCVIEVPALDVLKLDAAQMKEQRKEEIANLRFHPEAGPKGANVTYFSRVRSLTNANCFNTVTFERGIENLTLSCGTGVLAAAAAGLSDTSAQIGNQDLAIEKLLGNMSAELCTPGGWLHVKYGSAFNGAELSGPAELVFRGKISTKSVVLKPL